VLTAEPLGETAAWPIPEALPAEAASPPAAQGDAKPNRPPPARPAAIHLWAGAGLLLALALVCAAVLMRSREPPAPPSALYTQDVAKRVAEIAEAKGLPLPLFQMHQPPQDLDPKLRRFVGIWVSDAGWRVSGRQLMLIVAEIGRDGSAVAYVSHGPPQARSHSHEPPFTTLVNARVVDDIMTFSANGDVSTVVMTRDKRIEMRRAFADGAVGSISLDPVWTQVGAEEAASLASMAR
jgi:hypothetical protein